MLIMAIHLWKLLVLLFALPQFTFHFFSEYEAYLKTRLWNHFHIFFEIFCEIWLFKCLYNQIDSKQMKLCLNYAVLRHDWTKWIWKLYETNIYKKRKKFIAYQRKIYTIDLFIRIIYENKLKKRKLYHLKNEPMFVLTSPKTYHIFFWI